MGAAFNFNFTQAQLAQIIPGNAYASTWHDTLAMILPDYDINTIPRVAAFLAQTAHESNNYIALKENLNYRAESLVRVWPRSFPNLTVANQYAHNQAAIANRTYSNRMGNGSEESGDGFRYSGRGLIQLTGKNNYQAFADSIDSPIEDMPEYLATFEGAVQSACWYWSSNGLNTFADNGDILGLTKRINGGVIGLIDRTNRYKQAIEILQG